MLLRRRQVLEEPGLELGQQVGQPGEGELRLRLGRAGGEDERAEFPRQPDGLLPDGGLADSGLPDDGERGLGVVGLRNPATSASSGSRPTSVDTARG